MGNLQQILQKNNIPFHDYQDLALVCVGESEEGLSLAQTVLEAIVDKKTALFLSGGKTPKELFTEVARVGTLEPGVVGMVDERYEEKWHEANNELMLKNTGLLRYLQLRDIPFHPILIGETREKTAETYDQKLRSLFAAFSRSVAILGVGLDGHTAGIPANPAVWQEFNLAKRSKTAMVVEYDDHGVFYNQRVTMTFTALAMMDMLIVLVFGADKKPAIDKMFSDGAEDEIPSRFLRRSEIASKTVFITDQTLV